MLCNLFVRLWEDESGSVIATEYLMLGSIVALGSVAGMAEMCFLHYATEEQAHAVALAAAKRGVLFKRTAYNFVSLAHDERTISETLDVLDQVLRNVGG